MREIHADLEPAALSEIAATLRELTAQSMFGSAALVVSPGSPKSVRYLGSLTEFNELLQNIQCNPDAMRKLHQQLRDLQIEFGDWQRRQTEQLVHDFTETVTQVVGCCESSLHNQEEATEKLTGMQDRLSAARDCNDLVQIRQILKREVEEAQRIIQAQNSTRQNLSKQFSVLVQELEDRIAKAEQAAQTDHLTNLGNRPAFQFYAEATVQKVKSGEGPYCIVAMDLDGFKAINDTHGHDAGDLALNAFAGRLRRIFPKPAFVGRLGGDEFVVVSQCSDKEAMKRCVRLAEDLIHHPVTIEQGTEQKILRFGVSHGISVVVSGDTVETALKRADEALYDLKRSRKAA